MSDRNDIVCGRQNDIVVQRSVFFYGVRKPGKGEQIEIDVAFEKNFRLQFFQLLHIEGFVCELTFAVDKIFLLEIRGKNIDFEVDRLFFSVDRPSGFTPITRSVVNSERQPIALIQDIQVFETDFFKRLRGEVVKVTFDSVVPNAVDVVVFKVG